MSLLKPRRIQPGDTIGIVSPSGPIQGEELEKGLRLFQERGYKIVLGQHVLDRRGYLAGNDRDRASDLMEMFARKEIRAVVCSRGGYGAARLIPYLDPSLFRENPKIFLGYSDITVLHLWFQRHVGLVTFYAPMPITFSREVPDHALTQFWRAVEEPEPLGELPPWSAKVRTITGGKVQGPLTGGCLCLLNSSLSTSYEMETQGAIVLLEDVDEPPYRIDLMVNHLALAGKWSACAGVVIGEATRWQKQVAEGEGFLTPEEIWQDYFKPLGKPVIAGFPFGHILDPLTLPYGVQAELDADRGTLTLLESATVKG